MAAGCHVGFIVLNSAYTQFGDDWTIRSRVIAFYEIQSGGRPPCWIWFFFAFFTVWRNYISVVHVRTKF